MNDTNEPLSMIAAKRSGLVLYVKPYEACCDFYAKQLGLSVLFSNDVLTCFDLLGTYIMVEREDRPQYMASENGEYRHFSCLRIHVEDVKVATQMLTAKGVPVDYQEHSWGTVAKFEDTAGNLIAFKDELGFQQQVNEFELK